MILDSLTYATLPIAEILQTFEVSQDKGLTDSQATSLLQKNGPNTLVSHEVQWWQILLRQFKSSFLYLLIVAAILASFLGEYLDSVMIFTFILINTVLGFIQEYRSEQTVKYLKQYLTGQVRVIRNGIPQVIEIDHLVPGDILNLETGDIVPADVRLLTTHNFLIDESVLTGESVQVTKTTADKEEAITQIQQAAMMLFRGTTVVSGTALAVVVATGKNTQLGRITKLVTETNRESSFQININKISQFILRLVVFTLILVLLIHIFLKPDSTIPITELLVFAIALAVGVIPEALPLVITFSLSRGAKRLAKKNVVVKRLSAIEDLGSIEVLCSDKTGTLTENKLTVSDVYDTGKESSVFYGALCSTNVHDKKQLPNNAFDLALVQHLSHEELKQIKDFNMINEIPFDPERRRNSTLVKHLNENLLIVRGAAEEVILLDETLHKDELIILEKWIVDQISQGKRCLAIALRKNFAKNDYEIADETKHLKLIGLVAFIDPLKPTTHEVIRRAENLGVRLKIITGDNPVVSGAMAFEAGIIQDRHHVITGEKFQQLSIEEKHAAVLEYDVFARVSPQQKYDIIELLQEKYHVGYLGEGINDAPALKTANVALAVKGASDIAQEAADIVILKKDLSVIVEGIIEGRTTFGNTIKYIKATLLSNFGNFYALILASLIIPYLPMLPIQILLVNLLSDFPMIAISTDNVGKEELKGPKSYDTREIIIVATLLGAVSTFFDFIIFAIFKVYGPQVLQTNWFIGSILTELVLIFSIRTNGLFFRAKASPSVPLTVLSLLAFVLTIILPFTHFGQVTFHFIPPTSYQLGLLFIIVTGCFVANEVVKLLYYKLKRPR